MKRTLLQLACVLLLLFAQQSALTHAAWHAHERHPAQQDSDVSFQGGLCDLHIAFGAVLGGANAAPPQHPLPDRLDQHIAQRPPAHAVVTPLTPRSRAPPAFL